MPSNWEWHDRPTVHVDWKAYGICLYWMLGGPSRCYALQEQGYCKFVHPPLEHISRLWKQPEARLEYARYNPDDPDWRPSQDGDLGMSSGMGIAPTEPWSYGAEMPMGRAPPPPGHPVADPHPEGTPLAVQEAVRERVPEAVAAEEDAAPPSNSNLEPLGRPNRLLQRGYSGGMPTVAAQSVWKRNDAEMAQAEQERQRAELQLPKRQPGSYWANKKAPKVVQNDELKSQQDASEVELSTTGPPQEEARATLQPEATTTEARDLMPPPPLPLKTTATPYNKRSPAAVPKPKTPQESESTMAGTKRLSNGDPKPASTTTSGAIGPHPSTIRVAAPYTTQASIEKRLYSATLDKHERSLAEAKEDSYRLQGVTWIDNVRRSLQLPIKTFTTACCLYHKFRLQHPGADYAWADAAAASLLASCKIEDTLKKSRDILAAAYNLKLSAHDALSSDDVVFEAPSRVVIGLERLVLEAGGFDFRSVKKHEVLVKIAKSELKDYDRADVKDLVTLGFTVLTDLHRTFAPLKHTTTTQAVAALELASLLHGTTSGSSAMKEKMQNAFDYAKWSTNRANVMETLLDLLDLYTHHTTSTILGTKYSLDDFLRIRLALNKECTDKSIPRHQTAPASAASHPTINGATLRVANGHPTPVSPPDGTANSNDPVIGQPIVTGVPPLPEGGGTLRFVLNPQLAAEEKSQVQKYFTEEWEEYDEEIEVPMPKPPKPTRSTSRERDTRGPPPMSTSRGPSRDHSRDRGPPRRPPPPGPPPSMSRGLDSRRSRDDFRERDLRERDLRERDREYDRRSDYDRWSDYDRRSDVDDRGPPPPRGLDSRRSREDLRDRERDRMRDRDRERDYRRERDSRRYDDRRYDDRYERRGGRYDDYDRRSRR